MGGLNRDRKAMRGRKHCFSCKHVFFENEAKVTYDHEHFYCVACDDEKKRMAEIETMMARNVIFDEIDKFHGS